MRIAAPLGLLLALALACGSPEANGGRPDGRLLVSGEDPGRYAFELDGPARLAAGSGSELRLVLKPRGRFKLAVEFPLRLDAEGDAGLAVARQRQLAGDALRYDADGAEFAIDVTGLEAGRRQLAAELRFGICEEDLCEPVTRELAFALEVEPAETR